MILGNVAAVGGVAGAREKDIENPSILIRCRRALGVDVLPPWAQQLFRLSDAESDLPEILTACAADTCLRLDLAAAGQTSPKALREEWQRHKAASRALARTDSTPPPGAT